MPERFNKAAIIHQGTQTVQRDHIAPWQAQQQDLVTDTHTLLALVGLSDHPLALHTDHAFPLRVPREFVRRMEYGNPADPLLLQVLLQPAEHDTVPGYTSDPLEESRFSPVPGLLHKYSGRALMTVTGHCAIHCRYCFRRHFPYQAHLPRQQRLDAMAQWLDLRPDINELILSGGDPLSLSDRKLATLWHWIHQRPHIQRVRIHSRQPVVLPQRINPALASLLNDPALPVVLVIHSNHANELNESVAQALAPLRTLTLLNQSVLLKDINDNADSLAQLSERLFACGVLPYYLHVLDPVSGAAHFHVPTQQAIDLHQQLRTRLPGYLVPRLTQEQPGEPAKTVLRG